MKRGEVVLLAFPFSNGVGRKIRPALVVQGDRNNRRLKNTIVAMITTTTLRADAEPTQMRIQKSSASGKASGLLFDSAVKCENLFTIERDAIHRVIGHLPKTAMGQVNRCLRVALDLR